MMDRCSGQFNKISGEALTIAGMFYPMDTTRQKAFYVGGAVLFVALFTLSCLASFTNINSIPNVLPSSDLGWACLGLAGASFIAMCLSGVLKHAFDFSKFIKAEELSKRIDLTKIHVGRAREIGMTLALLIITLVGATHGCSLATMGKWIFSVQLICGSLYFTLPYFKNHMALDTRPLHYRLAGPGYEIDAGKNWEAAGAENWKLKEKAVWMFSGALMISSLVMACMASGNIHIPGVGWACTGLAAASFAALMYSGLKNRGITIGKENFRPGLWREVIFTLAICIIVTLPHLTKCTYQEMALGIVATHLATTVGYDLAAAYLLKKRENQKLSDAQKPLNHVANGNDSAYLAAANGEVTFKKLPEDDSAAKVVGTKREDYVDIPSDAPAASGDAPVDVPEEPPADVIKDDV